MRASEVGIDRPNLGVQEIIYAASLLIEFGFEDGVEVLKLFEFAGHGIANLRGRKRAVERHSIPAFVLASALTHEKVFLAMCTVNKQLTADAAVTALARKFRSLTRSTLSNILAVLTAAGVFGVTLRYDREHAIITLRFDEREVRTNPFLPQLRRSLNGLAPTSLVNANAHTIVLNASALQYDALSSLPNQLAIVFGLCLLPSALATRRCTDRV